MLPKSNKISKKGCKIDLIIFGLEEFGIKNVLFLGYDPAGNYIALGSRSKETSSSSSTIPPNEPIKQEKTSTSTSSTTSLASNEATNPKLKSNNSSTSNLSALNPSQSNNNLTTNNLGKLIILFVSLITPAT
jgi:hypothetical protein